MAGSLLSWAHTFVGDEVHSQLAAQQIYFPAKGSPAIAAPEFAAMRQYADQQLRTGAQADPTSAKLAATVERSSKVRRCGVCS